MKRPDGSFVVIFKDDSRKEVFLVLRSDKPIWNLPGGGIEDNESPEDTALRETFEETGFRISLTRKVGTYKNIDVQTGNVWNYAHLYEGRYLSGKFQPEFPGCEGEWFPVDALPDTTMPVTRMRIKDALEQAGKPFEKEYRPTPLNTLAFQVIDSVSDKAHKVNEDVWDRTESALWILDGASSPEEPYFSEDSDARWLADMVSKRFKSALNGLTEQPRLKDATKSAISDIHYAMQKTVKNDYLPPSAAVTMVEVYEGKLAYFSLGNVTLVHKGKDTTFVLEHEKNVRKDKAWLENLRSKGIDPGSKAANDELRNSIGYWRRQRMNRPDGYWILSGSIEAVDHAKYGTLPASDGDTVLLASDGFARLITVYNAYKNWQEILDAIEAKSLRKLLEELRNYEENDKQQNVHPRITNSDDATAVLAKIVRL